MTRRGALWLTYAIFVTIGFLGTVIGPALEDLAEQVGSTESAIGIFVSAMFLGSWMSQASVGPLMDRFGPRPLMVVGVAMLSVGVLGVLLSPNFVSIVVMGVLFGIGFGALDTGSNVLVAELYADNNVSVLNSLHLFFGVGAVIAPAVAAQTLDWFDSAIPAIWMGFVMVLLLWPGILRVPAKIKQPEAKNAGLGSETLSRFSYQSVLLWGLAVILLLYVSAEMGLTAWMTKYVEDSTSLSSSAGARLTAIYWFALTLGRLAGIRWGTRMSGDALMLVSLIGSLLGVVLFAAGSGNEVLTVCGAIVVGFFFGPIYPTMIAIATATFRNGPGKAASLLAASGSLGGMVGPPIQGYLLNEVSPSSSVIFVAAQCVLILVVYGALRRQREARASQAADPVRAQTIL